MEPWGEVEGQPVALYHLANRNGVRAAISTYGGRLVSLHVPDRQGRFDDVVRGYDELAGYEQDPAYFGPLIGRFANRIAEGRFTLDGVEIQLAHNENTNALHGGVRGFDKVVWQATPSRERTSVSLRYVSPHREEGYPGTLEVVVRYALTETNELQIDYEAKTDRPTVVNLTNHSYFNLAGPDSDDVTAHLMTIDAEAYTPVDERLIPTGALASVEGTPFDFRQPHAIGARLGVVHEQLQRGKGYDHNWVLRPAGSSPLRRACRVEDPGSGRALEVLTTAPGLQFYSGNFLDGRLTGKGGRPQRHRSAFVLETQNFPDAPNHRSFPSSVLRPGQTYRHTSVYRFSWWDIPPATPPKTQRAR
ncbi:MAG: galactose mutarotase [Myxococcales bacterium]|nr:galactose mutarotase [Myxococcales bacterium]